MADAETQCELEQGPTRGGRDRGFSIVEVVVTITLMAVVLVPIMSAVVTSIKTSVQGRSAAQVETALVNAADRVNRAGQDCDYLRFVQSAVQAQWGDPTLASVSYAYYQPAATPDMAGTWVEGRACPLGSTWSTTLVQRVTISVTSPDGDIHREIQVVKSNV